MKYIKDKKILITIISAIFILVTSLLYYLNVDEKETLEEISLVTTTNDKTEKLEAIFVDVKGSVKNPGVYKFNENDRVQDAIKKAGGLTKSANTNNINLSQKLVNEMVVYVYSNNEIESGNKILDCNTICETNIIEVNNCINDIDTNNLININKATLEELQTLSGVGESKAKNIIEYREQNGEFKNIEEIKNVSGIGDALYDSIKDKITT